MGFPKDPSPDIVQSSLMLYLTSVGLCDPQNMAESTARHLWSCKRLTLPTQTLARSAGRRQLPVSGGRSGSPEERFVNNWSLQMKRSTGHGPRQPHEWSRKQIIQSWANLQMTVAQWRLDHKLIERDPERESATQPTPEFLTLRQGGNACLSF